MHRCPKCDSGSSKYMQLTGNEGTSFDGACFPESTVHADGQTIGGCIEDCANGVNVAVP